MKLTLVVCILVYKRCSLLQTVEPGRDRFRGVEILAVFWLEERRVITYGRTYDVETSPRNALSFAISGGLVLCALE